MSIKFLKKEEINNFDLIIDLIKIDPNFENIGDIIYLLDRHDKFRENDDPNLKYAVYTVVNEILENDIKIPIYGYSPIAPIPNPIPQDTMAILQYIDKYWSSNWNSMSDIGIGYLLFFSERGGKMKHNVSVSGL